MRSRAHNLVCRLGTLLTAAAMLFTCHPAQVPDPTRSLSMLPSLPPEWQVTAAALADVTGDDVSEWVLLVWRPWQDWPIQRWSRVPSPIADFHDAAGESCHLVLLDPTDGREIWAGSALPVPLLALQVEDLDGDGTGEVLALEGTYAGGRDGPAAHAEVWRWNGFGFTLAWRSPPGVYTSDCLQAADRCGAQIDWQPGHVL